MFTAQLIAKVNFGFLLADIKHLHSRYGSACCRLLGFRDRCSHLGSLLGQRYISWPGTTRRGWQSHSIIL
jgi:hypothetical protein